MISFIRKWNATIIGLGVLLALFLDIAKNRLGLKGYSLLTIQYSIILFWFLLGVVQSVDYIGAALWELKHKIDIRRIILRFVLAYLNVIWSFGLLYDQIALQDQHAFNTHLGTRNALYFSVVTISTVGYGDIYPVSFTAKFFVCIEIFSSVFFNLSMFAFLSSYLVSRTLAEK